MTYLEAIEAAKKKSAEINDWVYVIFEFGYFDIEASKDHVDRFVSVVNGEDVAYEETVVKIMRMEIEALNKRIDSMKEELIAEVMEALKNE